MTKLTDTARERLLDWSLAELGGAAPGPAQADPEPQRGKLGPLLWAAASVAAAGLLAFFLFSAADPTEEQAQDPDPVYVPVDKLEDIESLPRTTRAIRGYDLSAADVAGLRGFEQLTHLDLSGQRIDARGYAVASQLGDEILDTLADLPQLRVLDVSGLNRFRGAGLHRLEGLRRLDLQFCGIDAQGLAAIGSLRRLESLNLSYCTSFPSSALENLRGLAELRHLDLSHCHQLRAGELVVLAELHKLQTLDLSWVQGQRLGSVSGNARLIEGDGVGVEDRVLTALSKLAALRELELVGCGSYTAKGLGALLRLEGLQRLDLGGSTCLDGALLARLPRGLRALGVADCRKLGERDWRGLARLPFLAELDISESALGPEARRALARLGGIRVLRARKMGELEVPELMEMLAALPLRELDLSDNAWLRGRHLAQLLPRLGGLETLRLWSCKGLDDASMQSIAELPSLRRLELRNCQQITGSGLARLAPHKLIYLDACRTAASQAEVRRLAESWKRTRVVLPKGQTWSPR